MPRRKQRRRLLPLICGCTIALLVGLQVGFHGDAAPPAAALELPGAAPPAEGLQAKGKKGWRTYQPSVISRKRTHGFLRRMKHHSGRNTIRRRQRHGRWRVSVT